MCRRGLSFCFEFAGSSLGICAKRFSPDSPFNPAFTLFGNDQLVIINYLRVFRWGEKVFELENLEPGDLSAGWDGTFRGQEVNPGVFVWVAEVVYEDGSSEVLKGDVTVIR